MSAGDALGTLYSWFSFAVWLKFVLHGVRGTQSATKIAKQLQEWHPEMYAQLGSPPVTLSGILSGSWALGQFYGHINDGALRTVCDPVIASEIEKFRLAKSRAFRWWAVALTMATLPILLAVILASLGY